MISEVFWLYLLTRLDVINTVGFVIALLSGMSYVMGTIFSFDAYDDKIPKMLLSWKWVFFVSSLLLVLVPNQKQMMFIISGTGLLEIAKSDDAQRIGGKSVQVFEKYLDEMLKDEKK